LAPGVAVEAHRIAEQPRSEVLDGRIFIIVSRQGEVEPRLQGPPGMTQDAPPIWGLDVENARAGTRFEVTANDPQVYGFPLNGLAELPEGEYFVQAFMNVYETFHRADRSVVKLHMPCGDGHRIMWSTGNIYSDVRKVKVTHGGEPIALELSHVIPPYVPTPRGGTCQQGNLVESQHVKLVKIKSERLTKFWGRPIYIGATVLLPKDYDERRNARYPVIFSMNHHPRAYRISGDSPRDGVDSFDEKAENTFSRWWLGPAAPHVIVVRPLSENPYYDTSYWVNSANAGPYGDALLQELLPAINKRFRTIDAPWARTLTGCSSGGWMSAAPQIFYPDAFGGAFIFAPDIVDFRATWLVNLYEDKNAFWNETPWRRWPRPYFRDPLGNTLSTTGDWAHLELALGNKGRSGEYFNHMDATFGPQGQDGYPVPRWNPVTGEIDPAAVKQYEKYDLSKHLETNWSTLEAKLRGGRLQFFVTETDNYYTNLAVHQFQDRLEKLTPSADARFNYFPNGGHCQTPITQEQLLEKMAKFMTDHSPAARAAAQ
jgi:hypothetical protein